MGILFRNFKTDEKENKVCIPPRDIVFLFFARRALAEILI